MQFVEQLRRSRRVRVTTEKSIRRRQNFLRAQRRYGMREEAHPDVLDAESSSQRLGEMRRVLMPPSTVWNRFHVDFNTRSIEHDAYSCWLEEEVHANFER